MKALAGALGIVLVSSLFCLSQAQTIVGCDLTSAAAACPGVDQVVCIGNFSYSPPVITVNVGDTVAWVNIENFCLEQNPPTGCDPHHTVDVDPDLTSTTIHTPPGGICSPHPGTTGLAVPTTPPACLLGEANVYCHTFVAADVGVHHYNCRTNPAHTAFMHGAIIVQ